MVEPYPGYGAVREARSRDLIQTSGSYRTPSCYEMGAMDVVGPKLPSWNVRFSNRPFEVKRFQTIRRCGVDVTHGLVLLFGIGTKALPSWDSRTGWSNLCRGLYR